MSAIDSVLVLTPTGPREVTYSPDDPEQVTLVEAMMREERAKHTDRLADDVIRARWRWLTATRPPTERVGVVSVAVPTRSVTFVEFRVDDPRQTELVLLVLAADRAGRRKRARRLLAELVGAVRRWERLHPLPTPTSHEERVADVLRARAAGDAEADAAAAGRLRS